MKTLGFAQNLPKLLHINVIRMPKTKEKVKPHSCADKVRIPAVAGNQVRKAQLFQF